MDAKLLKAARKLAIPSKEEEEKVKRLVNEILGKVNAEAKKQKIQAELVVGGSIAKGTWLPGISDIDFFLRFDYDKYNNLSGQLSDFTERILKKCFKGIERIRGSRDYFNLTYENFTLEIVPVLKLKKPKDAKNITDFSPSHVNWIKKHLTRKDLVDDIRLAKQFFKASGVYGAESYINGFSGHVIELLTINCGSFEKLLKAIPKWKIQEDKEVIDVGKRYKKSGNALKYLNKAKLHSPIIVIDPVQPMRNAAAALNINSFSSLLFAVEKFTKKPTINFFREKEINTDILRKRGALILKANPFGNKHDVMGAKYLKNFKYLRNKLLKEEFKILEANWWWPKKGEAIYWFRFGKKPLSKIKLHKGPPMTAPEIARKRFTEKWKDFKLKIRSKKYYVEIPRKFTDPKQFLEHLIADKKLGIKFLK